MDHLTDYSKSNWYMQAERLEKANKLQEMVQMVEQAVPYAAYTFIANAQ